MNDVASLFADGLIDQFRQLPKPDRRDIMRRLPEDARARLQAMLAAQERSQSPAQGEATPFSDGREGEYAPWLLACLDAEKREVFPALRSDFQMTPHAQSRLRIILGMATGDAVTSTAEHPLRDLDEALPHDNGPSLVGRMGNFLSRKVASL